MKVQTHFLYDQFKLSFSQQVNSFNLILKQIEHVEQE